MKPGMQDPRLVIAAGCGVGALAAGAAGVATQSSVFAVLAAGCGVFAAIMAIAMSARAREEDDRFAAAEMEIRTLRREVATQKEYIDEQASKIFTAETLETARTGEARSRGEEAFDAATGLYDERYFAVLVQQQVAAARRSLRPVSVVIFEIDGMTDADGDTRLQALGVVGDVVRRTLRESDAGCRLGDLMVGAILEDTAEAGAVWAAERVRGALLSSPIGDAMTLSAGVACYPSHALGAAELVHQASRALEEARNRGRDRVELAPEAS